MFRSPTLLALALSVFTFSIAAQAQQNAPTQADAPAAPASSAEGAQSTPSQDGAGQNSAPAATALPDDPGTTAHVQPIVEPEGPTAVFDTSMGRMVCRLYSREAPIAVANFVGLATGTKEWKDPTTHKKVKGKPFYDGTTFHRVIPAFMIQGGDPTATGSGDAGYFFADEVVPTLNFDVPGRLAMANAGPNTNGSQFFITVAPQPSLDQHYSIFGQCGPASVQVAEAITQVPRNDRDKPLEPVYLNKVTIVPNGEPLPAPPPPAAPQPGTAAPTQH
ncbi:MAG: peptidylprolyl isomerase [Acidobacteriaceae bacterium]